MNGKDLFEGMSYVDERFVDEAENKLIPKPRVIPWLRAASVAACLCLILFSIYHIQTRLVPDDPGSPAPNGVVTEPKEQPPQDSNDAVPGDIPTGENPNVILYVEEMTDDGFLATVTEWGETDRLGLGTKLNVVFAEGTRSETADGDHAMAGDSRTDLSGCYVVVQFFEFDEATATIEVDTFSIVEEEG